MQFSYHRIHTKVSDLVQMKKTINQDSGKSPVVSIMSNYLINYLKMSMKSSMLLLFIEGFNSLITSTV